MSTNLSAHIISQRRGYNQFMFILLEFDGLSAVHPQSEGSLLARFEGCWNNQIASLIQLRPVTHLLTNNQRLVSFLATALKQTDTCLLFVYCELTRLLVFLKKARLIRSEPLSFGSG